MGTEAGRFQFRPVAVAVENSGGVDADGFCTENVVFAVADH